MLVIFEYLFLINWMRYLWSASLEFLFEEAAAVADAKDLVGLPWELLILDIELFKAAFKGAEVEESLGKASLEGAEVEESLGKASLEGADEEEFLEDLKLGFKTFVLDTSE